MVKSTGELVVKLQEIEKASDVQQLLIINELYDYDLSIIEGVLLQVMHLSMTLKNNDNQRHLHKFLLHLASSSTFLGIRLAWIIDAAGPGLTSCGLGQRVSDIQDFIETVVVNSHVSSSRSTRTANTGTTHQSTDESEKEAYIKEIKQKEARLSIFNQERYFVNQLTKLSSYLVKISDKAKRKGELRRQLALLNDDIIHQRRILFPLSKMKDKLKWIVNIVVEECVVFSSRERAPYLIFFETITDSDVFVSDPSLSNIEEPTNDALSYNENKTKDLGSSSMETKSLSSEGDSSQNLLREVFGESAAQKRMRIKKASPYGQHPGWSTEGVIVKAGDDLKQEELALQIIDLFDKIWKDAKLTIIIRPYSVMATSPDAGIMQLVTDSSSIDGIKKAAGVQSLHQFFVRAYGGEESEAFNTAQRNFIESMAGYSIICYLLQIKDRHNGNLMLTVDGCLVHIDFGFMLSTSPGGANFERAPFKLSQELLDVMGGCNSATFQYFKILILQGMVAVQKRSRELLAFLELMVPCNTIPCFGPEPRQIVKEVENRLRLDLGMEEFALYIRELIGASVDNWRTKRYDQFQTFQNGII